MAVHLSLGVPSSPLPLTFLRPPKLLSEPIIKNPSRTSFLGSRCASSFPASSPMESRPKLMEFPHLLAPHRDLMITLIAALETRLDSHLLPVSLPPDVEFYQNETNSSQGSLCIRKGRDSSPIDFMLASWLHLKQPSGDAFNITNLQVYLKPTTNAPHFQFELVQCSPTYLIFFLDLTPRKDLVLNPDYLKTFYEHNQLEPLRRQLDELVPESKPYFSSSLYFRQVVSPTGILVSIKSEAADGRIEEIMRDNISPIANQVLGLWIDECDFEGSGNVVGENEKSELEKRDYMIKSKAVQMDLSASMPLQFGQEVADRVLGVIRTVFNI
ncbi:hypothetical protein HS088_TW13G01108 [Tripterygium wilfordii]|uniref:Red chlorophyll catabolite reductase chloroplastic n=1 Tax=Tripterygium wilfordii TaxID=458696 RepID=A0A7J7CVR5_TRIWF|nr:red chlorophyll catabolite reductase-like [Tripterygium wilfordii]KAF5738212.1 hypothetical protein HS088_TW13G01108 [Tripterygium wilfordii]